MLVNLKILKGGIKKEKNDQGPIYKDFEEKSTFPRHLCKKSDYEKFSIWIYDNDIKTNIKNFKNINNDVSDNIKDLIKRFEDEKNSIKEIEEIGDVKIDLKVEVKKLQVHLEKLENILT